MQNNNKNTPAPQKASRKKPVTTITKDTKFLSHLGDIYRDINNIEMNSSDSFDSLLKKFYKIMTKWGICQGNWSGNGRTIATPEWNICWNTFKNKIESRFMFMAAMSEPPKHLLAYGKKPKIKLGK